MMRAFALALAVAASVAALVWARPHPTPGPPMRDFEAYYAAGASWNAGRDAYTTQIWDAERPLTGVLHRYEPLPFIGPPALLPVWGTIARLPFATANTVWRTFLVLCGLVLVFCTLLFARIAIGPAACFIIAVFALGFGPLTSAFALGQIALPAYAFTAVSLFWPPSGILAWVQPNVALTLAGYVRDRKSAAAFAGGIVLFIAACCAVTGWHGLAEYARLLRAHQAAEQFAAIQITPASIAYGAGLSAAAATAIGTAVCAAALLAWIVLMQRQPDARLRFCGTCALLPLAMPFFHEHDLIVTFVPAVYITAVCRPALWPFAAAGALLCGIDWLGLAQRPDGEVQTLLLSAAAATALVLLRAPLRWTATLWPFGVVLLIAAVAPVAAAHKMPVWPDAMLRLPTQGSGDTIAAVWHAEQAATGLFGRDGVWSGLRTLPLLGCVILIGLSFERSGYSTDR